MFQNIYCSPYNTSQTTKALCDGEDIRYCVMFVSADDGSACAISCAAYHGGQADPVAFSMDAYGDKITTF